MWGVDEHNPWWGPWLVKQGRPCTFALDVEVELF